MGAWRFTLVPLAFVVGAVLVAALSALLTAPR
jgi:hypothetical protein